jgi:hypothetical protein
MSWSKPVLLRLSLILRQRLDQIVEAKPQAPAMMIESYRKEESDDEESHQDCLITRAKQHQPDEARRQDDKFSNENVGEDCTDEEPFLPFEE